MKNIILSIITTALISACASVPTQSVEHTQEALKFKNPMQGMSGLYIYRKGLLGAAIKKDIWVDGECVGESAPNVFFYKEVEGNSNHTISTESEFSPNDLDIYTEDGKNYFIRQYIKLGVIVGGAGVELVEKDEAIKDIQALKLAIQGTCSQ